MKVSIKGNKCIVTKEPADKKLYRSGYGASSESQLLYKIKKILIAEGYDLIKKHVQKDGHMFGHDGMQYLRTRNKKSPTPHIFIFNNNYAYYDAGVYFNEYGEVILDVMYDVFK